jgi:adenylate kinase family enzyme
VAVSHTVSVQRISVVGNSGSGKTTFASELAQILDVPHLELDSVFHQPGWQPLERAKFRERVAAFTTQQSWVADGNYRVVRDILWGRADTVVWIDLARRRVMRRVIWRTVRRAVTRVELWNGNREPLRNFVRLKPEESIITWAWTHHRVYQEQYLKAQADPANSQLDFIRLRTPSEVAACLRQVADQTAGGLPGE